jgi:hypothetical protein
MSQTENEIALKVCLSQITHTIGEAQKIAHLCAACLEANDIDRAFNVALDIEPCLFDADKLLQAAATIRRNISGNK